MNGKMQTAELLLILVALTGIEAQLDVCGQAPNNNRIIGGQDAAPGAWPWQASLHYKGEYFCGGSLINSQWVLCVAHCFSENILNNQSQLTIYLGRDTQELDNPNEVGRSVSQIIIHSNFSNSDGNNDIALVQLSSPVSFTDYINPVCLAGTGSEFEEGTNAWVTGWGNMAVGVELPSPQRLKEAEVPIVTNEECNSTYGLITENMICAGVSEGGTSFCQRDSGSPLVVKDQSLWVECGIVSFSRGCGEPKYPGVYTRVSKFEDWIKGHMGSDQPGFMSVRMVTATSSSTAVALHLLTLTLPLLLFLQLEL